MPFRATTTGDPSRCWLAPTELAGYANGSKPFQVRRRATGQGCAKKAIDRTTCRHQYWASGTVTSSPRLLESGGELVNLAVLGALLKVEILFQYVRCFRLVETCKKHPFELGKRPG